MAGTTNKNLIFSLKIDMKYIIMFLIMNNMKTNFS